MYNNYFAQLRSSIPLLLRTYDIKGFSLTITNKLENIFSEGFGYTDSTLNKQVTENTRFSLQSISKTYTAFGFMLAVESGSINLDDPLIKYIPTFKVKSRDNADYSKDITFRHLLTNRSGLAHEAPAGNNYNHADFDRHIASINNTFLRFQPNTNYSYSNLGFDLIAYTLQKLYGIEFEEYMNKYVFDKLGMEFSTYKHTVYYEDDKSAVGHDKNALPKPPTPMLGAGGMYSSSNDMAKFIRCVLNNGMHQKEQIIQSNTLEKMYSEYPITEKWAYNLGFDVGLFHNTKILNHNGGGYGFYCSQDILIDEGIGAAALTNSVTHPTIQHNLIRNIWEDFKELREDNMEDCAEINIVDRERIGVYCVKYFSEENKIAILPRNGSLYLMNDKLNRYNKKTYFTDDNDIVEFLDDRHIRINNVEYYSYLHP